MPNRNEPLNLPPLQVGRRYRLQDFEGFQATFPALQKLVGDGDKATLLLHLSNGTILELPCSEADIDHLRAILIEASPSKTLELVKERPWFRTFLKEHGE